MRGDLTVCAACDTTCGLALQPFLRSGSALFEDRQPELRVFEAVAEGGSASVQFRITGRYCRFGIKTRQVGPENDEGWPERGSQTGPQSESWRRWQVAPEIR